ncbi:MAG: thymidine phosphorylase [Candidatus Promineifilaceae bacterium]
MDVINIIEAKRDGRALSPAEIAHFVAEYSAGRVPDYQAAALLMAIYLQGMDRPETVALTQAMANSGQQLDLHDVVPFVVDKHSSGGVGDKTSLVVLPLVAACSVPVGKMSGRGLGPSGGTLDKMEAIPGWSAELSLAQFKRQLAEIGLVLAGQTAELAPADGKLYALRDVTATVASRPLIAASIMSKKLAAGADAVVLDVKVGRGAFTPTPEAGRELAQLMVDIGRDAGRRMVALLADMNQPLGHAVGNALEVKEAIETLAGTGPADLWAHCLAIAAEMLLLASQAAGREEAEGQLAAARSDGRALAKFRQLVAAQGGAAEAVDDPERLPQAALVERVRAERDGFLAAIDARAVGWSCVRLGAGRQRKGEAIDPAVGMVIPVKVGDHVEAGQMLAEVHANDQAGLAAARAAFRAALSWSAEPVEPLAHFYGRLAADPE